MEERFVKLVIPVNVRKKTQDDKQEGLHSGAPTSLVFIFFLSAVSEGFSSFNVGENILRHDLVVNQTKSFKNHFFIQEGVSRMILN